MYRRKKVLEEIGTPPEFSVSVKLEYVVDAELLLISAV
jgi:hypothetical protein